MNEGAVFSNITINDSDSIGQVIVIDSSVASELVEEIQTVATSADPGTCGRTESWKPTAAQDVDNLESALSSSDDSSPNKANLGQNTGKGSTSRTQGEEKERKKAVCKKYGRVKTGDDGSSGQVEDSAAEVRRRFQLGCECAESCFRGLNPDSVYRHRLNIAELTKEEHDMYLMGVTMACMSDPVSTNKRRERRRARPNYAYSGRRVCLSAFLYLENVTLYQLKRIRKHVMTHGVTPRIHGNHGKKPHNVFPLDIYRKATSFLKDFTQQYNSTGNPKGPIILPADVTRKSVHNTYRSYVHGLYSTSEKILGYSTFRHFMKEQFPNLRFSKTDPGSMSGNAKGQHSKQTSRVQRVEESGYMKGEECQEVDVSQIPVFLAEPLRDSESETLVVAPLSHFLKAKDLSSQTFAAYFT